MNKKKKALVAQKCRERGGTQNFFEEAYRHAHGGRYNHTKVMQAIARHDRGKTPTFAIEYARHLNLPARRREPPSGQPRFAAAR